MSTYFFDRLRTERERLGKTQEEFAVMAGVTRRPYVEWEKGSGPAPNALQLAAIAAAGADVLFIVTGQRSQGAAEVDLLPADERVLVDAYRRCNADAKRNLIQTAALLSAGMPNAPARKATQGGNNVQIGGSVGAGSTVFSGTQKESKRAKKPA